MRTAAAMWSAMEKCHGALAEVAVRRFVRGDPDRGKSADYWAGKKATQRAGSAKLEPVPPEQPEGGEVRTDLAGFAARADKHARAPPSYSRSCRWGPCSGSVVCRLYVAACPRFRCAFREYRSPSWPACPSPRRTSAGARRVSLVGCLLMCGHAQCVAGASRASGHGKSYFPHHFA